MSDPPVNVTKLKVAPVEVDATVLETFDEIVAEQRQRLVDHPNSGFVILTYRRPNAGKMTSAINYHLSDPLDAYALPEFVAERIKNLRDGS